MNIAVRLEGLAEAGGICISEVVYNQVKHRVALGYEDLGEHSLKNIEKPVRVYRVQIEPGAAAPTASTSVLRQSQHERMPTPVTLSVSKGGQRVFWYSAALVVMVLLLIGAGIVAVRRLYPPPSPGQPQRVAPTPFSLWKLGGRFCPTKIQRKQSAILPACARRG